MNHKTIVLTDYKAALEFVNTTEKCIFPVNLHRPGDISEYNGKSILNMMIVIGSTVQCDYHEADAAAMEPVLKKYGVEPKPEDNDYELKDSLDDGLLTGNTEIDNQHQNLILFVNYLADACENDNPMQAKIILRRLRDYANMHFDTEVRQMIDAGFPTVDIHSAQHQNLIREINVMQNKIEQAGSSLEPLAGYVRHDFAEVFRNHIRRYDIGLCRYLQDRLNSRA